MASLSKWPAALLLILLTGRCIPGMAQEKNARSLADAIGHHRFVFYAQWVTDYTGHRRQLTPPYELLVTSDSIRCFLPFAGRMYAVPSAEEQRFMSIDFSSKNFGYEAKQNGKRGWDIRIRPRDVKNAPDLHFSISRQGWTSLTIRSSGRDRVSYEGQTEAPPAP